MFLNRAHNGLPLEVPFKKKKKKNKTKVGHLFSRNLMTFPRLVRAVIHSAVLKCLVTISADKSVLVWATSFSFLFQK